MCLSCLLLLKDFLASLIYFARVARSRNSRNFSFLILYHGLHSFLGSILYNLVNKFATFSRISKVYFGTKQRTLDTYTFFSDFSSNESMAIKIALTIIHKFLVLCQQIRAFSLCAWFIEVVAYPLSWWMIGLLQILFVAKLLSQAEQAAENPLLHKW